MKRNHLIIIAICICLLTLFSFVITQPAKATPTNLYFQTETQTVNTIFANKLTASQENNIQTLSQSVSPETSLNIGVRVYIVHSGGSLTELTSGVTTICTYTITDPDSGAYSTTTYTWSCPQNSLASTDAVEISLYIDGTLQANFITGQLGDSNLDAGTWTFNLASRIDVADQSGYGIDYEITAGYIDFGGSSSGTGYNTYVSGFNAYSAIPITITSSPTGSGFVTVDGNPITTPTTFNWAQGSSHTIAANSPANVVTGQSQYTYSSWSDSGAQSHSYTVPGSAATVTASFQLQFYLTVQNGYSTTGQGWVNSGGSTTASSSWIWGTSGGSRNALINWQLDGTNKNPTRQNTGTLTTSSITMNTYHTVNFVSTTQNYLTVSGGYSVSYGTASPTSDNWYDLGTSTTVTSNWISVIVGGQSRYAVTNYAVDGVNQNPTRQYSSTLTSSSATMNAPHTVAFASTIQYYFSVASTYGSPTGQAWYDSGSSINSTVTTPISGTTGVQYVTSGYTGAGSLSSGGTQGTNTTVSFLITAYSTCTWNWVTQYYLTVTSSYGSPVGQGWYNSGVSASFSVTSPVSAGVGKQYVFSVWVGSGSGAYSGSTNSESVTMNNPISETVTWLTQYYVTSSSDAHSSITASAWETAGTSPVFTYSASGSYTITNVVVDGVSQSVTGSYTFTNIQASHMIAVTTSIVFTITSYSDANSTVSPSGAYLVTNGGSATFYYSPNTGYTLNQVLINGSALNLAIYPSSYTFNSVGANYNITVSSVVITFTITTYSGSNSFITPSGTTTINYGSNFICYFTASSSYHISEVLVNGTIVSVTSPLQLAAVTANYVITVSAQVTPPFPVYPNSISNGGAWQYLLAGNFVGFIFAIWGAVLTVQGFFMLLGLMVSVVIYLQMKNLLVLIALWTIMGSFFIVLMPLVSPFAILFYILAIAGVIYKILASPKP